MQDCISVKHLKVYAYHGVLPEENRKGQYFYLDIRIYGDFMLACYSDDVTHTVNYDEVCNCAYRVMTENTYHLIERAAQAVCNAILIEFPQAAEVEVTVYKPSAPVKCDIQYAAVTIRRGREGGI